MIISSDIRDARASVKPDVPIEPIWRSLIELQPFQMNVWSSQRVSYATFFNAYETFIVRTAKVAWGKEVKKFRTTSKEFKQALRGSFANDLFANCWDATDLKRVRFVRHALTHTGGRETDDLKELGHNIKLIDGVLQIMPDDNRALIKLLQDSVECLVDEASKLPQFAS